MLARNTRLDGRKNSVKFFHPNTSKLSNKIHLLFLVFPSVYRPCTGTSPDPDPGRNLYIHSRLGLGLSWFCISAQALPVACLSSPWAPRRTFENSLRLNRPPAKQLINDLIYWRIKYHKFFELGSHVSSFRGAWIWNVSREISSGFLHVSTF